MKQVVQIQAHAAEIDADHNGVITQPELTTAMEQFRARHPRPEGEGFGPPPFGPPPGDEGDDLPPPAAPSPAAPAPATAAGWP